MGLGHVLILLSDFKVDDDVGQSLNLMAWDLQFFLDFTHTLLGQQHSSVFFDLFSVYHFLQKGEIEDLAVEDHLQFLEVPQALVLETWDFCGDFETFRIIERDLVDNID